MALEGTLAVSVDPDAVDFEFEVTNAGTEPVTLEFPSGQLADIAVSDATGEVWRWSDGRLFTQAIESRRLAPNESLLHVATWSDPPSGAYTAEAVLAAPEADIEARADFVVS